MFKPSMHKRKQGRAMEKNMQAYYNGMKELDLRVLLSKKRMRILKLEHEFGWFNNQEKRKLEQQVKWILTELACREQQEPLF